MTALNIKNEETYRLAREVAGLAGESITEAVTEALRERRNRLRNQREGLAEWLMALGEKAGPLWKEPWKSTPHGELLYDEHGLPK